LGKKASEKSKNFTRKWMIGGLATRCNQVNELDQAKGNNWQSRTSQQFLSEERPTFRKKISKAVYENDVPKSLIVNLDQTPLSYVSPGRKFYI